MINFAHDTDFPIFAPSNKKQSLYVESYVYNDQAGCSKSR